MQSKKKKKSLKRELIEWAIFLGAIAILYMTGLHTEVIGGIQRLVLKTGIIRPEITAEDENLPDASYNFSLVDPEGQVVPFDQFKDKVVFINFWATWCPPCIAEMPDIQQLYEEVNSKDIVFAMISLDDSMVKAKEFIQKKGFTFPVYQLNAALPQVYASQSIPTTFVLSPEGKVVSKHKGMANYNNKKFRNFLKEMVVK